MSNPKSNTSRFNRTRHDFFYCLVATRYFVNFNRLLREAGSHDHLDMVLKWREELRSSDIKGLKDIRLKELSDKYDLKKLTADLFNLRMFSSIVIVNSAMCLEALINDYCILGKSSSYFKNYIDRLDTTTKWLVIPKLITNKEISTDSQAFELIKKLFALRNNLVHPKSHQFNLNDEDIVGGFQNEFASIINEDVQLSYQTIKEATQALYNIDPNFKYLEDYKWMWVEGGSLNSISELNIFYSTFFSKGDIKEL